MKQLMKNFMLNDVKEIKTSMHLMTSINLNKDSK